VDVVRLPARPNARLAERVERWLAVGLVVVTVLLLAGTVPLAETAGRGSVVGAGFVVVLVAFLIVGAMLVRTRPGNAIAWSMLAAAFFGGLTIVSGVYAVDAYRLHHHLPLASLAVVVQPSWAPMIFLIALALMLFPDGVLPSGRWRWAMGAVAAVGTVWMVGAFAIAVEAIALGQVKIEPSGDLYRIDHPTSGWAWWSVAQILFFVGLLSVGLLWLISRVPGYRAASGDRRQQLKWLICGGAVACIGGVLSVILSGESGVLGLISSVAIIGLLGIPLSIGVGISKYRLYEIDRLISRTLSYVIVTGLLAGVFAGIIVVATDVLPFSSPVAVAASTLAAAALFNPLRQRVQHQVDRRFNRARYDGETIIAAFTAQLREAVDLETVRDELLHAVDGAVQPAHTSLWVKPATTSPSA
jgi:hypothetical protein